MSESKKHCRGDESDSDKKTGFIDDEIAQLSSRFSLDIEAINPVRAKTNPVRAKTDDEIAQLRSIWSSRFSTGESFLEFRDRIIDEIARAYGVTVPE